MRCDESNNQRGMIEGKGKRKRKEGKEGVKRIMTVQRGTRRERKKALDVKIKVSA
jgi:hypothetical protein